MSAVEVQSKDVLEFHCQEFISPLLFLRQVRISLLGRCALLVLPKTWFNFTWLHLRWYILREAVAGYPVRVTADVKLYRVSTVTRKSVQKRPVVGALFILSEMIFTCLMLQGALQHDLQFTLVLQWILWYPLVSFLLSSFYFRFPPHSFCWCSSWGKKSTNRYLFSTFFLAWISDNMSKSVVQVTEVIFSPFWYMLLV